MTTDKVYSQQYKDIGRNLLKVRDILDKQKFKQYLKTVGISESMAKVYINAAESDRGDSK